MAITRSVLTCACMWTAIVSRKKRYVSARLMATYFLLAGLMR